ncbi:iron-containing alcohol dehydrogenase family protein [Pseudonocardia sp. MH-G8]|uniref:iron-containing alcohol dehydrogenase family protein n=1 Tax=Pseudonocardia sp. MH-G8 TaxID=1854588 RepID=UPI000BA01B77|nr:iron-containing alcohol dehydrogenase [Pseudonocardia sp. MH-G8]OZM79586.1 methanol dehydrogenase [Pseudonocardia sp. MH-G8]
MISTSSFTITPPGRIEFGRGALDRLPEAVASVGRSRAFVVTDRGIAAAGILDRVRAVLTGAGLDTGVFAEVEPNPSVATIDEGAARARAFGDAAVVAVGGGSSLDAAKGIALLAVNAGAAAALDLAAEPVGPGLPVVAVPTTAGTGAETNGFGVIEDTGRHCKVYLGHASVAPRVSVLDPDLTVGLPARATAATGVDALVHGIESLTSRGRNPVSEAYAHHAVRLVHHWLPRAVEDGADREARAQLLLGSHLAGLALSISGLGLVHGIAHALTAHTGTPHGVALGAVLDRVLAFNLPASTPEYAQVAVDMGCLGVVEPGAAAAGTVAAVREFTERLGMREPLPDLGVTDEMVPDLVRTALADAVTRNNPRTPTPEELTALLTGLLAEARRG